MKTINETIKNLENLIKEEDELMESLKKTDPGKVDEKFSYILGISKALSMIKKNLL